MGNVEFNKEVVFRWFFFVFVWFSFFSPTAVSTKRYSSDFSREREMLSPRTASWKVGESGGFFVLLCVDYFWICSLRKGMEWRVIASCRFGVFVAWVWREHQDMCLFANLFLFFGVEVRWTVWNDWPSRQRTTKPCGQERRSKRWSRVVIYFIGYGIIYLGYFWSGIIWLFVTILINDK